jgi:glycosyltransferase involved in cell wall biosynthesis
LSDWFALEMGLDRSKILQMPNIIKDELLGAMPEKSHVAPECIFVGHIKREKGVFDIIEAFGSEDSIKCDFYGPIVSRDREAFLSAISNSENLSYNGVIDPDKVGETIGLYDILLLPSYHGGEGYPAVILEAYAVGVPVVTTRWRSIPDIVEDGVTGLLVPVKSPGELRTAVERLSGDQTLYDRIRMGGHDFVRNFSEERIVGGMLVPRVERLITD